MDLFPERFGKEAGENAPLPKAGTLIMGVWREYLANFKAYASVAAWLLLTLPFTVPGFLMSVIGVDASGGIVTVRPDDFSLSLALSIIGTIGVALINVIVRLALNAQVAAGLQGRRLSWREALRSSRKPFWPFIGALIIVAVIVGLGFSLLFVPGIIFGTFLLCTEQAVALEGLRPVAAIKRSIELVRGHSWPVFWRAAVGYAVIALGSLALTFPLVQYPTALIGHAFAHNLTALRLALIPVMIIGVVISALAQPLFVSLQVHIFEGLKRLERKP